MSVVEGYATAFVEVARAENALATVGSELLTVSRAIEATPELHRTLTDQAVPADRRQSVVEALLGGKAHPITTSLVSMTVGSGRTRELPAIVDAFLRRAANEQDKVAGEVRTAHPLTSDQQQRLNAAIDTAIGKQVDIKFLVDPSVIGGVITQVGDTIIDGTVRRRLNQLKEAI